jgi:acetyl-CoA carboxylase carboxyl transferase subunit alpha
MANPARLPFEEEIHELERLLASMEQKSTGELSVSDEILRIRKELVRIKRQKYSNLSAWETVLVSRHGDRPQTMDYVRMVFEDFTEIHGDRAFGDDRAMRCGFSRIGEQKLMVIGHQKGHTLQERQECMYGCAHPEGYRKSMRAMTLAAKFQLPVLCMIDTPGAFPGIGSEERGIAQLIADSLLHMATLPTPIFCVVIGEGGSGGALGIGIGDGVAMLEHAYYSVISPEGCAGILWKTANDQTRPMAAEALKLTSRHCLKHGVIDEVLPEPLGGAHRDPREMANTLKNWVIRSIRDVTKIQANELVQKRFAKFRSMGTTREAESATVPASGLSAG